jgi:hypothetical protein
MSPEGKQMPDKSVLNSLDWNKVGRHFRNRVKVSGELVRLHDGRKISAFAELAIGSTHNAGNYSAAEHPILRARIGENLNWRGRVYDLATKFRALTSAKDVPDVITNAKLNCLQIGVGSEMSCMVNPDLCWVCNVRTIWFHLAWTKGAGKAEKELRLYREGASDAQMAYMRWADVYHPLLRDTLIAVAAEGETRAMPLGITASDNMFLWADAIASYAYGQYHGE